MELRVSETNPHYLAVDGHPVFLIGAVHPHGWRPLGDPDRSFEPDIERLGDVVAAIDSPHVRGLLRVLPYTHGEPLQPWVYDADAGVYDLDSFDPAWEARLTGYLDAAAEREHVVSLELWDDWSITRGTGGVPDPAGETPWDEHPFNPQNNRNYGEDALTRETSACDAPFYATVFGDPDSQPVLERQREYVAHLVSLVDEYENVVFTIANESRATLEWSRYWAAFVRETMAHEHLVTEMPSTARDADEGECDPDLSPSTLLVDDRYDYVDCSQALSAHSFGTDVEDIVPRTDARVGSYYEQMAAGGDAKPLVVSKDYTNEAPDGRPVVWSKFVAGTASVRFHRPQPDRWGQTEAVVDFQFDTIANLGAFVAETEFWRQAPDDEVVTGTPPGVVTVARSRPGASYVVEVVDGSGRDVTVSFEDGTYAVDWYDTGTGEYTSATDDSLVEAERGRDIAFTVPDGSETQVLYARDMDAAKSSSSPGE